jgi:hypothetical protein
VWLHDRTLSRILHELCVKVSHRGEGKGAFIRVEPTAQIHRDETRVHPWGGHTTVSCPPGSVPEFLKKSLPESDTEILCKVMGVYVEISPSGDGEGPPCMMGKEFQHVGKETAGHVDAQVPGSRERERAISVSLERRSRRVMTFFRLSLLESFHEVADEVP